MTTIQWGYCLWGGSLPTGGSASKRGWADSLPGTRKAAGTHPTGMLSCCNCLHVLNLHFHTQMRNGSCVNRNYTVNPILLHKTIGHNLQSFFKTIRFTRTSTDDHTLPNSTFVKFHFLIFVFHIREIHILHFLKNYTYYNCTL